MSQRTTPPPFIPPHLRREAERVRRAELHRSLAVLTLVCVGLGIAAVLLEVLR